MVQVKNNKQTVDTWCGMEIQPASYYTIQDIELSQWQNNSKVLSDIGAGNLIVNDGSIDITDVATAINKLKGNQPTDSSGRLLVRQVAAAAGWKAQFNTVRISTSTTNGFHNKDKAGNDLGFCTYTMYDASNQVTTNTADCVKTVVTWEPTHDIEVIGGRVFQKSAPTTDMWLYVTVAAHIPANYGGSVVFAEGGVNLSDIGVESQTNFDGRVSKYVAYDSTNHTGRFEILVKHDAGIQHNFNVLFEFFKP
jgi:hypothetical protein